MTGLPHPNFGELTPSLRPSGEKVGVRGFEPHDSHLNLKQTVRMQSKHNKYNNSHENNTTSMLVH